MRTGWRSWVLYGLAAVAMSFPVVLVASLLRDGAPLLSWHFLTSASRPLAAGGGVGAELFNTLYVVGLALAASVPAGLLVAILRREYGWGRRWGPSLEAIADFGAGVPSVVVGFLVFVLVVGDLGWPFSRGAGVVALFLLNVPWVAASSMAVLASVPESLREASLALGAAPWDATRRVVLPSAAPGLVEAAAVGAARLLGESAALLFATGVNAVGRSWSFWAPGATLAVHVFAVRTEGLMPDATAVSAASALVLLAMVVAALLLGRVLSRWFMRRSGLA